MNLRKQVIVAAGLFLFMEEETKERPFEERGKTNQALVELLTARGLGGGKWFAPRTKSPWAFGSRG